jgi:hypothetical protein
LHLPQRTLRTRRGMKFFSHRGFLLCDLCALCGEKQALA